MTTKVIMVKHREQRQMQDRSVVEIVTVLFADADDGMIIGSACMGVAQWGPDLSSCRTRHFMTQNHAVEYIKQCCRKEIGRDDVDFLTQEADPLIKPVSVMPKRNM